MQTTSFWTSLAKPIIGLSPMDGVTDAPFRHIQKKYGAPAVLFTEFSSVEGITHHSETWLKEFFYDESQRPVVAQLFGTDPNAFYQATLLVCWLGFDGVDINMGCPAKNVAHRGAGAGLIQTHELAMTIVESVQQAVKNFSEGATLAQCPDLTTETVNEADLRHGALPESDRTHRKLPVSIKTRIGYDQNQVTEWIPRLLETQPEAITIHGRTLKQQYGGSADWEAIGTAAQLAKGSGVKMLGNGDLVNRAAALEKIDQYHLAGALIGRASMGNPFVFRSHPTDSATRTEQGTATHSTQSAEPDAQLPSIALEHARLFEQTFAHLPKYSFLPMRKQLGWYIRGHEHAKEIRSQLIQANCAADVETILARYDLMDP